MEDGGWKMEKKPASFYSAPSSIFYLPSSFSSSTSCLRALLPSASLLQLINFSFLGCDEGIKLGNFHGVTALLFFTEAENIGLIFRPPAVEIETVFFDGQLADRF